MSACVVLSVKAKHLPGPEHPCGQVQRDPGGGGLWLGSCIKLYSRILCADFCTVTAADFFHLFATDTIQRNVEFMLSDLTIIIIIVNMKVD